MPVGTVHKRYAIKTQRATSRWGFLLGVLLPPLGVGIWLGGKLGRYIGPDRDLKQITLDEREILDTHPAFGAWWVRYWHTYEQNNPHQGRSHRWPHGTIDRMWYLLKWPMLASIASAAGWIGAVSAGWMYDDLAAAALAIHLVAVLLFWVGLFIGVSAQDLTHIYLDKRVKVRRYIKKRWWGRFIQI